MLKTVEELKKAKDQLDDVTCEGDQYSVNTFVFDALIGITEHLEEKSTHDRLNEILVTESSKVSNTCQQIIREIEKIKEHMPPVENTVSSERIEGRLEGLEWVSKILSSGISWIDFPFCIKDAIVRVKDRGNLE